MARGSKATLVFSALLLLPVAAGAQVSDSGPTLPDPFERAAVATVRSRVAVSVRELQQRNYTLEVEAGAEVLWADPHFLRVWFPPGPDAPHVEQIQGGFRAVFEKPGTYRGLFTLAGWSQGEIYRMRVVVRGGVS